MIDWEHEFSPAPAALDECLETGCAVLNEEYGLMPEVFSGAEDWSLPRKCTYHSDHCKMCGGTPFNQEYTEIPIFVNKCLSLQPWNILNLLFSLSGFSGVLHFVLEKGKMFYLAMVSIGLQPSLELGPKTFAQSWASDPDVEARACLFAGSQKFWLSRKIKYHSVRCMLCNVFSSIR